MPSNQRLAALRLARPTAPSCRGGASSLLRQAQPAALAAPGRGASSLSQWFSRAAAALSPAAANTPAGDGFAPSQWLVGH